MADSEYNSVSGIPVIRAVAVPPSFLWGPLKTGPLQIAVSGTLIGLGVVIFGFPHLLLGIPVIGHLWLIGLYARDPQIDNLFLARCAYPKKLWGRKVALKEGKKTRKGRRFYA